MLRWLFLLSAVLFAPVCFCSGAIAPSPEEVKAGLRKATDYLTSISTEGGYLWRYSKDLRERRGEEKATASQIWVQPPGTPSVGMAFLDAYSATKDARHLSAAQAAALALVRGQLESGGWAYLVEFDPQGRKQWAYRADSGASRKNISTFDDDNTQSALRFLMAFLGAATNQPKAELKIIRDAVDYGLAKMIVTQYPNGAWPQRHDGQPHDPKRYPVRPARIPKDYPRTWPNTYYGGHYTLNDNTQRDCIRTMLDAYKQFGDRKYLAAARKGGEFLVLARLPEPQPSWAQQYNSDMEPAWARAFEPPAVCSNESGGAMRILVDLFLETGDERFLQPIPAFIAWLKRSQIGPDKWARCYELGTNKPIYGDRDGKIHYAVSELSQERQQGYSWQGSYGIPGAIKYYDSVRTEGREKFLARQKKQSKPVPSQSDIAGILSQQDAQGRWFNNGWIDTRTFITNMQKMSDYLRQK